MSAQRSREVVEQAKQERDYEQSSRWTTAQKHTLLGVIKAGIAGGESRHGWSYADVPLNGGTLHVSSPNGRHWWINTDGIANEY